MRQITRLEWHRLVYEYIGVEGGYLGNFSYPSHERFYPLHCGVDVDPTKYPGTTRERFIQILTSRTSAEQARIVRGAVEFFPLGQQGAPVTRTQALREDLLSVAERLERSASGLIAVDELPMDLRLHPDFIEEQIGKCSAKVTSGDFDGAITNARSLVEAVLKELLALVDPGADAGKPDLPRLYKEVNRRMNLDPARSQHPGVQSTLRGLIGVVGGLAEARNRMSDAHAPSYRPLEHHARLVVNAAFALCLFLVAAHESQVARGLLPPSV